MAHVLYLFVLLLFVAHLFFGTSGKVYLIIVQFLGYRHLFKISFHVILSWRVSFIEFLRKFS